jgi:outer membrane protein, heavy metal efflux system
MKPIYAALIFMFLLAGARAQGTNSLDALIETALANNPEITAAHRRWDAALQKIPQARALDDPMVGVDVERSGTTRFDTYSDNEWMISQNVPWFGKRDAKGRVEEGMARKVEQEYRAKAFEITSMVKQAYYDLWQAQRELELNARNQKLMEQFVGVTTAKYEVGKSSQADVLKAETELAKLKEAMFDVQREVEKARAELNQQLNRAPETPVEIEAGMPTPTVAFALPAALKLAAEQRPELLAVRLGELSSAKASLDLAKKEYMPDVQFRVEARQFNGQSGIQEYDTGVFMNFPWLQLRKRKAMVREAKLNVEQKQFDYEALQRKTAAEVKKLYDGMEVMHHHYELFIDKIIPQQRAAVEAAQASYETDKADFLDLLDAQRMLLDFEMQNLHHTAEFYRLAAELERLTGGQLPK